MGKGAFSEEGFPFPKPVSTAFLPSLSKAACIAKPCAFTARGSPLEWIPFRGQKPRDFLKAFVRRFSGKPWNRCGLFVHWRSALVGARIIRRNIVAHNLFIMSILLFRFYNKIGTVKHLWTFIVSRLYGRIKWTLKISVLTCLKTGFQNGRSHCPS